MWQFTIPLTAGGSFITRREPGTLIISARGGLVLHQFRAITMGTAERIWQYTMLPMGVGSLNIHPGLMDMTVWVVLDGCLSDRGVKRVWKDLAGPEMVLLFGG